MDRSAIHLFASKLLPFVGLAELPAGRRNVVGLHSLAVAGGDPEGERLPRQRRVGAPVLPPVPGHADPRPRPLHVHRGHVPVAAHIEDEGEEEVGVARQLEPDAALPAAVDAAELDGHDAHFSVRGDLLEHGHGQVEMLQRRAAPVTARAYVGGGDDDAARGAIRGVVHALHLVARAARRAVVVQRRTQRRRLHPVVVGVAT